VLLLLKQSITIKRIDSCIFVLSVVYTPIIQNREDSEVLQLGEDLTASNEAKGWPLGEIRAKVSVY
jgi:hypothetical protein